MVTKSASGFQHILKPLKNLLKRVLQNNGAWLILTWRRVRWRPYSTSCPINNQNLNQRINNESHLENSEGRTASHVLFAGRLVNSHCIYFPGWHSVHWYVRFAYESICNGLD